MKPRTLLTAALLLGCIGILQYHAIQFWIAHTGPLGAAWSLLLEGAALWLWSDNRATCRALGALVTILLLAGHLYQVSAPLIEDSQRAGLTASAGADRSGQIEQEVATLEGALATYLANSATRQGWVGRIDHTQARIEQLRAEQASLTAARAKPAPRQPWQATAVVAMEALAIVIFQLVAVLCIGELHERRADAAQNVATATPHVAAGADGGLSTSPRSARAATGNFQPAIVYPLRRAMA